jgi:hypothetical protein
VCIYHILVLCIALQSIFYSDFFFLSIPLLVDLVDILPSKGKAEDGRNLSDDGDGPEVSMATLALNLS